MIELYALSNPWSWASFGLIASLVYCAMAALIVFIGKGHRLPVIDGQITEQEKDFYKSALVYYFGWAIVQQFLVIGSTWFLPVSNLAKFWLSVGLFSAVFHFPNYRLMVATFAIGLFLYFHFYILGFNSILQIALIHSLGGTLYKITSWDMRVWRM